MPPKRKKILVRRLPVRKKEEIRYVRRAEDLETPVSVRDGPRVRGGRGPRVRGGGGSRVRGGRRGRSNGGSGHDENEGELFPVEVNVSEVESIPLHVPLSDPVEFVSSQAEPLSDPVVSIPVESIPVTVSEVEGDGNVSEVSVTEVEGNVSEVEGNVSEVPLPDPVESTSVPINDPVNFFEEESTPVEPITDPAEDDGDDVVGVRKEVDGDERSGGDERADDCVVGGEFDMDRVEDRVVLRNEDDGVDIPEELYEDIMYD